MKSMGKIATIRLALLVLGMSVGAAAQSSSQSQPDTTPAPAFGQSAPILNPENPPVTGLDEPSLDLHTANRSFVSTALQVSESADTNASNQLNNSGVQSVSRIIGALDLQQFWPKSDVLFEYIGGGAFYSTPFDVRSIQAVGFEGVTRWRTGELAVRDAFSYLPDGSFEIGAFGGAPGFGIATGGGSGMAGGAIPGTHLFGSGLFGAVGNTPRLTNLAILDAVQAISPRAAITFAGGFSNAHFFDPTNQLINSDAVTVEAGYTHLLGRRDQIGAIYAFQLFQFPQDTGGQIYIHIINGRWSHAITGKLSLLVSAGPQYTELEQGGYLSRWSLSARVQVRYKMGRADVLASYEKFSSTGSGFYVGSNVQAARLGYIRPLGRTWVFYGDLGYAHNTRIQPTGNAIDAGSYDSGSASAIVRKHIGRTWEFIAGFRFGEEGFSEPICVVGTCGRISSREVGGIGLEWHPAPLRIE